MKQTAMAKRANRKQHWRKKIPKFVAGHSVLKKYEKRNGILFKHCNLTLPI
jgi:hypothetical protein